MLGIRAPRKGRSQVIMNFDNLRSGLAIPETPTPTDPRRELNIHGEDETIIDGAIEELDKSNLKTEDLFEVFSDWQTKKTLTAKRIFVSTSILVAAAAWIGIDYTDLSLFGLKVANGSPDKFITFILLSIVVSGIFYEFSRRIDASVRKARINNINNDLKSLVQPIGAIDEAMKRNSIDDFSDLYFDFRSPISSGRHDAIDVYRAVKFYQKNLSKAGFGLTVVTIMEHTVTYAIAVFAVAVLAMQLAK